MRPAQTVPKLESTHSPPNGWRLQTAFNPEALPHIGTLPALERALSELRNGDKLVVNKLDRFGRSLRVLLDIAAKIHAKGGSLTAGHTTYAADPVGATLCQVLGWPPSSRAP
ncbi:hypothetical protein NCCP2495_30280 [Dietzia sp. NCCP-2495]|uniref:recombinase family protein n=1 Tax=Dietzia sp. NCCP-2495 TaxID=2934675 RepID=UPI0022312DF1|nr:recombinase family protein [Dietzia sp. NCCP-2495]GLB65148.1 hypothetical protein NCCP2495_30280 [Dietzia sp. NCCP-2495]